MLEWIRRSWRRLKRSEPGERFQDRYRRRHEEGASVGRKILFLGGGGLVFAAGIFFLPAPGPGIAIVALGAALVAQESLAAARALDWAELRIRAVLGWAKKVWDRSGPLARGAIALLALAVTAAGVWGAWRLTFGG